MNSRRTILGLSLSTAVLLLLGSFGLSWTGGLAIGESFYVTLMILLTHYDHHGFTDTRSRLLVILLILASLVLIGYLLKWFAEYMMGLGEHVRKRKMMSKITKLQGHYIVCGLGRVGSQVAREMHHEGVSFVAVDRDQARVDEATQKGYLAIVGDSTDEAVLLSTGVEKAQGLVATLGEDSHNLFVTLAARSYNPELYIVARANRQENETKLKRAGADRVALPYQIGGYHMATMALRPNVVDYLDIVSSKKGAPDLEVEEMIVTADSKIAGHRLGDYSQLTESTMGATVIAINGVDGKSRVRPTGKEVIYPGDRLIILGAKQDLTQASELIR
jgi:voltage-gated potassium channel